MVIVEIKKNREKALANRHPWLFSGGIHRENGSGPFAEVLSWDKKKIGWGLYNPNSPIRVRFLGWSGLPAHPERFIVEKIRDAVSMRETFLSGDTNAFRLINGEGDGLPGVVADIYGEIIVLETTCGGWEEVRKEMLFSHLKKVMNVRAAFIHDENGRRRSERLGGKNHYLSLYKPTMPVEVRENGLKHLVNIERGQETGAYLDRRPSRALAASLMHGMDVLNVFSYTGGFSVAALSGGARHVTNADSSLDALDLVKDNHRINGIANDLVATVKEDAFEYLKYLVKNGRKFDAVILDPPPQCRNTKQIAQSSRVYRRLNAEVMKLLHPGGLLMTFTSSHPIDGVHFRRILFEACADARTHARVLKCLGPGWDFPVDIACPETEGLKGLLLRVG